MSRARNYVFTLNNYLPHHEVVLDGIEARYLVYGREVGESGTPHLQGYISFHHPKTFSAAKKQFPNSTHLEVARGSHRQASDYCKKDGNYEERGTLPQDPTEVGRNESERWERTWELAKTGNLEQIDADIRIRSYSTLKKIARDYQARVELLGGPCGIWIYGNSGCGKTSACFSAYPSLYPKGINKWWCGYQGEEVVLLDDIDPTHASWIGAFLKRWADKYPFIGESKGGSYTIRPKKFIVTSQYTISDIFPDKETRDALARRFVVINKVINQNIILF